ncbi:MAG: hypothetical protein KGI97_06580 [Alphaproteobacteria bacterium]|nr:hypothetical protein [Alphaproteobacteria bacterium]
MAEAKKAAKGTGGKPKKKGGKAKTILIMVALGIATPFMLPTVVLLLIGMIPTYIAFATDDDPQKSGAVSVGAMNFAGVVPFIIQLWQQGQTIPDAFRILATANDWLIILGAAGIGQLVVYAVPQAIATLTLTHAETRIKHLKKNLETLKEFWGPEVATTKPIDQIVQD